MDNGSITEICNVDVPTMDGGTVTVRVGTQPRDTDKYWERRVAHGGEACEYCGRKVGKRDLWIFVLYGGDIVHPDDVPVLMVKCDGLVGWYRVGPTCAKRYYGDWTFTAARMKALPAAVEAAFEEVA